MTAAADIIVIITLLSAELLDRDKNVRTDNSTVCILTRRICEQFLGALN